MSSRPPVYTLETVNNVVCRRVAPYIQEFETFAKGRWLGREFLEVLCKEFGGQPPSYWRSAIRSGNVRINDQITSETYRFKNSDKFLHRTHRHEPPVFGSVDLIGETSELLAVCKPSSMPIHPSGAYCFNTLENVLRFNPLVEDQPLLYLVHRLDKVTSGLVILAKNKNAAASVAEEIRKKTTKKVYLAKVRGRFPRHLDQLRSVNDLMEVYNSNDDEDDGVQKSNRKRKLDETPEFCSSPVSPPLFEELCAAPEVSHERKFVDMYDEKGHRLEKWIVNCPIGVVSFRDGVYCCHPQGKKSLSSFVSLGYDEDSDVSMVLCLPHTGRTHQLRLHLELCGNPIANDPCYGGELFFGEPDKRQSAISAMRSMNCKGYHPLSKMPHLHSLSVSSEGLETSTQQDDKVADETFAARLPNESNEEYTIRLCRYCKLDQESEKLEQSLHCDGIWLHALQYSFKTEWKFRAPIPSWSAEYASVINAIMEQVDKDAI